MSVTHSRLPRTTHRVVQAATGLVAVAALTLGSLPAAVAAPTTEPSTCAGVWVVVDAAALDGSVTRGCATSYATGVEALTSAGYQPQTSSGLVLKIDGLPATGAFGANSYWTYWHATENGDGTWSSWSYSQLGAGSYHPVRGAAEGWRFVTVDTMNPPAPSVTPPQQSVSITATSVPASLIVGQAGSVTAKVGEVNPGGRPVALEVRTGSSAWSTSRTGTTAANGSVTLPLTYGATSAGTYTYRLRVGSGATALYSSSFTVKRLGTTPVATSHPASAKASASVSVKGTVPNTGSGRTVWAQFLLSGKWVGSRNAQTNASGQVTIPLTYGQGKVGKYTYRLSYANPYGVTSTSPSYTLTRTR
jgi:hypothetical protein